MKNTTVDASQGEEGLCLVCCYRGRMQVMNVKGKPMMFGLLHIYVKFTLSIARSVLISGLLVHLCFLSF